MKKIGIIAGLGPESTIDYYQRIITSFKNCHPDLLYPEIILYSVNMNELLQIISERKWSVLVQWLADKIDRMKTAGAQFAAIASNTPHVVFKQLEQMAALPLVSIVEATCGVIGAAGYRKVALLGTRFTMEENFYRSPCLERGCTVVVPRKKEQEYIHEKLWSEIELGIFRDDTRKGLLTIVNRIRNEQEIDAVILGCTELPLILPEPEYDIPFLNTTAIHCDAIVTFSL
jgi:aspartate racemase